MPIVVQSKNYLDWEGNSRSFYKANVGDPNTYRVTLKESILVQSGIDAYLSLDPVNNIITWAGGNWENEGFRVGDTVMCVIYTSGGGIVTLWVSNITSVNVDQLDITACPAWIDATAGQIFQIFVTSGRRESMILNVNHVVNGQVGNEYSSIDGEATRFKFDIANVGVGGTVSGIPVGNQSGQYVYQAAITLQGQSNGVRIWDMEVQYVCSPINEPNYFLASSCAKLYVKQVWQRLIGEPYGTYVNVISDDADTGYFDEPFNNGGASSALVQGINVLDYENVTQYSVVVDGSPLGIGACYCPQDEAYYKHRTYSQSEQSMIVVTSQLNPGNTWTSGTNEFGANYQIQIDNVNNIGGSQYEVLFTFIPSVDFATFMDGRDPDDRLFKLWIRAKDINLLAFNDQLTKVVPIGGPLKPIERGWLYHNENQIQNIFDEQGVNGNIEDDLAFSGVFRIPYFDTCSQLTAKVVARNSATGEEFILSTVNFGFDTIPQILGIYQLNEVAPVITTLPTTSEKREARLFLEPTYNDFDNYAFRIYYPFLYRWEYWLDQPNADTDFYPNQNKNWFPYGNTGDWQLNLDIQLVRNDLMYTYTDDKLIIKDYDSEDIIDQDIELIIDSTNQTVGVIAEGQMMRVRATHVLNNGTVWDPNNIWGMITVEPKESAPRWICSTIVPFDNNTNNPLTPLSGLLCDMQVVGNLVTMECYFDPTKINLQNDCKFTTKIKGCSMAQVGKQTTDGIMKQKTDGTIKEKSE